jgi:hypothetical protein
MNEIILEWITKADIEICIDVYDRLRNQILAILQVEN